MVNTNHPTLESAIKVKQPIYNLDDVLEHVSKRDQLVHFQPPFELGEKYLSEEGIPDMRRPHLPHSHLFQEQHHLHLVGELTVADR